jgi:hypothetical protein
MKAEKKLIPAKPAFQPMELTITFENAKELELFQQLFDANSNVIGFLYSTTTMLVNDRVLLEDLLGKIYMELTSKSK